MRKQNLITNVLPFGMLVKDKCACLSNHASSSEYFYRVRAATSLWSILLMFSVLIALSTTAFAQQDILTFRKNNSFDKGLQQNVSGNKESALAACTSFTLTNADASSNSLTSIIQSLVGPGVTVSNVQTTLPATSDIYGTFSCGTSVVGIEQGLVITTGSLSNARGPNSSQSAGRDNNRPSNTLLNTIVSGQDASAISFSITPTGNTLTFNYVFSSEEYNDFVGSGFNDVFGFFISGPGITGTRNIALIPGTNTPVAINNVNKGRAGITATNPSYFINNDIRTLPAIAQAPDPVRYASLEHDGLTVVIPATITVIPGQTYTLTFAIQDVGDGAYDSGVFIEGGSIQSSNFYYSKSTGDLQNVLTWGINPDGSGTNPPDFGAGNTFQLANRPGIYSMTADWSVSGTVNIPTGSQLQIAGNTLSIAQKGGGGTFSGSTTSNLVALASSGIQFNFTVGANSLSNLTVDVGATATLGNAVDLYSAVTVNGVFNVQPVAPNIYLTFKSTPTTTARLAASTGTINGFVWTEQFIPARRAWRMMNSSLDGPASIFGTWQESRTNASSDPNPNPGYGTHITGGTTTEGFDQNPGATYSIKRYDLFSNNWVPLLNTTFESPRQARMLFVRGDRSIPLGLNTVPPNNTTLRAYGFMYLGNLTYPVNATGFTAVPNLYQSPVNFATLTRNNVQNNFYVWDPKMGGVNGTGAYVLISWNGSSYDVIPASISPESQYIQTNQSFLVRPTTAGTAGSVVFKESDKVATTFGNVFRTVGGNSGNSFSNAPVMADAKTGMGLRVSLRIADGDETSTVLDETFVSYSSHFSDKVDDLDGAKPANIDENLGVLRDGQTLMVERRSLPKDGDVIALSLWNTKAKAYLLELNPINLLGMGLTAYIEDKFLKTITPISSFEKTQVLFSVTSDPASAKQDRFQIRLLRKGLSGITTVESPSSLTVYPNPLAGNTINILFADKAKGSYQLALTNSAGQVVFRKTIQHTGGTATQPVVLGQKLPKGIYQLQVIGGGETTNIAITCQ